MKIYGPWEYLPYLSFKPSTDSTKEVKLYPPSTLGHASLLTLTLPDITAGSDTLVGAAASQALTNKTINASLNTISNITDSMLAAGAAIARSKIAAGTASHVLINAGDGSLSSEATLAKSRGGAGADMSGVTFPSTGVITTDAGASSLSNKSLDAATVKFLTATARYVGFDLGGATNSKTLTLASIVSDDRTITFPDATDTVAVLAANQAFTTKTYNGLSVTTGTDTFTLTRGSSTLVRSGAHACTLTTTNTTSITLPTTGTVATTTDISTHASLTATHGVSGAIVGTTDSQALTGKTYEGLSISTGSDTFTLTRGSATLVRSGAHACTLTTTNVTNVTLPTTGTLATTSDLSSYLPTASFTDAAVTGKYITGYSSGAGVVAGTDTILEAINKLNGNTVAHTGASSGVHGLSGSVVGTTDSQALSNKTLDAATVEFLTATNRKVGFLLSGATDAKKLTLASVVTDDRTITFPNASVTLASLTGSEVLTNKDIDGGTASDSNRITIPKNTSANLAGLTRKQGTVVYDTTLNKLFVDNGSALTSIGSGSGQGELNYITNTSAADAITGWTNVGDLDVVRTTTAAELPRENLTATGIKITADSNAQSAADYVYYDFTLDDVDLGRVLKIQWDQKVTGSLVANDLFCYIATQAARGTPLYTPSPTYVPVADGTFAASFVTSSATQTLSLVIAANQDMATDAGIVISNVIVGPGQLVQGPAVSDWQSYTPSTAGFGTISSGNFAWRRVGDSCEIRGYFVTGTVSADIATVALPTGLTSSSTLPTTSVSGVWTRAAAAASANDELVLMKSSDTKIYFSREDTSNNGLTALSGNGFIGSSEGFSFLASVPISGWSSGVYLGSGSDSSVSALNWSDASSVVSINWDTNISTNNRKMRRVGDSLEIIWYSTFSGDSGAAPTNLFVTLTGLSIDTAKLAGSGALSAIIGTGKWYDADAGLTKDFSAYVNNSSTIGFNAVGTSALLQQHMFDNTDEVGFYLRVPIVGWTAQDYLGKMLTGFATAKVGTPGLVNNDSSNTAGTPILGRTDGANESSAAYIGWSAASLLNSGSDTTITTGATSTVNIAVLKGTYLCIIDAAYRSGTSPNVGLFIDGSSAPTNGYDISAFNGGSISRVITASTDRDIPFNFINNSANSVDIRGYATVIRIR